MSFDIFLQYAQREAPQHADLDGAVASVVRAFGGSQRDEFGYFFDLVDGGSIELHMTAGDDNAMLAMRGLNAGIVRFMLELMQATGWVALVPNDENDELVAAARQPIPAAEIYDDFPEIIIVSADEDLAALLAPAFGDWADYRDQVVKD